ncbi:hypothetical protein ACQCVP_10555 [Rossellomorea vietnamensis]
MFSREKKAVFPFILLRLFDPEGLGAAAGRNKSGSALSAPTGKCSQEKKRRSSLLFS